LGSSLLGRPTPELPKAFTLLSMLNFLERLLVRNPERDFLVFSPERDLLARNPGAVVSFLTGVCVVGSHLDTRFKGLSTNKLAITGFCEVVLEFNFPIHGKGSNLSVVSISERF